MTLLDSDPISVAIGDLVDQSTDTHRAWEPKSARHFSRDVVQL